MEAWEQWLGVAIAIALIVYVARYAPAPRRHRAAERARRKASERTARHRPYSALTRRVRVPLVGAAPLSEEEVKERIGMQVSYPETLEVRRYGQDTVRQHTVAEFAVVAHNSEVAVRIAERAVEHAGFIPSAAHVVSSSTSVVRS